MRAKGPANALLAPIGTVLSQSVELPRVSLSLLLTYGPWLLGCIVITNGYASLLLSLLTTPNSPIIPGRLEELPNSSFNFKWGSITMLKTISKGIETTSSALLSVVETTKIGLNGSCRMCDFLLAARTFIPGTENRIDSLMRVAGSVLVPRGGNSVEKGPPRSGGSGLDLEGRSWVFLEGRDYFPFVLQVLSQAQYDQKPVQRIGRAEPFAEIWMWKATKSYVTRLAMPFFARLFASGIYRQWEVGREWKIRAMARSFYLKDTPDAPLPYSNLFLPRLLSKEPHPLTRKHFKIPFIILAVGLFLSALAFIREMTLLLSAAFVILKNSLPYN
jgi:hypothetical protein